MEKIAKPNKINYQKSEEPNRGTVTVEPFYPGYGMTLGNSLRRVLLSSLPGAAVTGVKIKGANHEFTTLPHVKEDVLDIILNLKKLRLKVTGEEEQKLELEASGKKKVTAADISKNSQVDIINSDLELANITDVGGNLSMEITVAPGRGYQTVEQNEEKREEIGFIEVDAVFSPVLSVGINVENVRVGKMTNWDKLILDIVTDGTVDPKEAFDQAVNVLVDQFQALQEDSGEEKETKGKKSSGKKEEEEDKKEEKKETSKKTAGSSAKSTATKSGSTKSTAKSTKSTGSKTTKKKEDSKK